jgi:hypothetical protein
VKGGLKTGLIILATAAVVAGAVAGGFLLWGPGGDGGSRGGANGEEKVRAPRRGSDRTRNEDRANVAAALERLNSKVVGKTKDYLYPAKIMVQTTARTLNRHTRIYSDPFFEKYLLAMLDAYPQLDYVYIADRDGNRLLAAKDDVLGRFTSLTVRTGTKEPYRIRRYWDGSGKLISTKRHSETELKKDHAMGGRLGGLNAAKTAIYDPRVRIWYQQAVKRRALCWTDVYIFNQNQKPGLTAACPAIEGRDVLFVVAADFEVKTICKFLAETKAELGKKGTVFIINYPESDPQRRGDLVAYPVSSKVVKQVKKPEEQGSKPVFAKARDVVDDHVGEALARYEKARGAGEDLKAFRFDYRGESYIASFQPFLESFGNDWKIVVVVPESDLLSTEAKPEAKPGK